MTYGNLCRPYPETIEELERKLDIARMSLVDADHALRIRDDECRKLRSEIGTLRFEATQLMAENAEQAARIRTLLGTIEEQASDAAGEINDLVAENDGLRSMLDYHVKNAKQQAERIRELEAASEKHWRMTATGQQDLPPTRAEEHLYTDEEIAIHRQQLRDGHAKANAEVKRQGGFKLHPRIAANRIANEANEERD